MHIPCQSIIDYVNQQRKPTRASSTGVSLIRDNQSQICLAIGKLDTMKKNATVFKLEESLTKVYSRFVNEGKCTIELQLTGGSITNILISKAEIEPLKQLVTILEMILNDPESTADLELIGEIDNKKKKKNNNDDDDTSGSEAEEADASDSE
eukprot:gene4890-6098_t